MDLKGILGIPEVVPFSTWPFLRSFIVAFLLAPFYEVPRKALEKQLSNEVVHLKSCCHASIVPQKLALPLASPTKPAPQKPLAHFPKCGQFQYQVALLHVRSALERGGGFVLQKLGDIPWAALGGTGDNKVARENLYCKESQVEN